MNLSLSIAINTTQVANIDALRLNGNQIKLNQFMQLPSATAESLLRGIYIGTVRIPYDNSLKSVENGYSGIETYVVISHGDKIYKSTQEEIENTLNRDETVRNKSEEQQYTEDEQKELNKLALEIQEVYRKYVMSLLVDKINHNQSIYELKDTDADINTMHITLEGGREKIKVNTRLPLSTILNGQLETNENKFETEVDMIVGLVSSDTFNERVRELFRNKLTDIENLMNYERKDWFTGDVMRFEARLNQDIKKFKLIAEKFKGYDRYLIGDTTEEMYSDTTLSSKLRVILTSSSTLYTEREVYIGDLDINLNIFKGTVDKIKSLAEEMGVGTGDTGSELVDTGSGTGSTGSELRNMAVTLEQTYNLLKSNKAEIENNLVLRKEAEQSRYNMMLNKIKTEIEKVYNKPLLIDLS